MKRHLCVYFWVWGALVCSPLLGTSVTVAADLNWAERMFSDLKVDFGTVARGADTRHQIVIENLYEEDITILDVKTTCGCTAAKPDRTHLKTHETARIEVVMDTKKFMNRKDSNVDVTLQFHGARGVAVKSVRVPITAYIRSDVVLTPGNVDFGVAEYGQSAVRKIHVAYAGRPDWKITGVKSGNASIKSEIREVERAAGRVSYELTVQLLDQAPVGALQDRILLLTDDRNSPEVPVLVTGRVSPDIEILPSLYALGELSPGDVKQFNVIIKGKRPFTIAKIQCDTYPDCFEIRQPGEEEKTVHVIPFRLTAPTTPGEFEETFVVQVAGRDDPLTFFARGTVTPGS